MGEAEKRTAQLQSFDSPTPNMEPKEDSGSSDAIYLMRMVRNSSVIPSIVNSVTQWKHGFYMFDAFDRMTWRSTSEKDFPEQTADMCPDNLTLRDFYGLNWKNKSSPALSDQYITLCPIKQEQPDSRHKTVGELVDAKELSELPYFFAIFINLMPSGSDKREKKEVFADIARCKEEIQKKAEAFCGVNEEGHKRYFGFYYQLNSGDFCLLVRSNSIRDGYCLSTELRGIRSKTIIIDTYSVVGVAIPHISHNEGEKEKNEIVGRYLRFFKGIMENHNEGDDSVLVNIRLSVNDATHKILRNQTFVQSIHDDLSGVLGRYDVQITLKWKEFLACFPAFFFYKFCQGDIPKGLSDITEDERDKELLNTFIRILKGTSLSQERLLTAPFPEEEGRGAAPEGGEGGKPAAQAKPADGEKKNGIFSQNQYIEQQLNRLGETRLNGFFAQYQDELSSCLELLEETWRLFAGQRYQSDSSISGNMFYAEMMVILWNCTTTLRELQKQQIKWEIFYFYDPVSGQDRETPLLSPQMISWETQLCSSMRDLLRSITVGCLDIQRFFKQLQAVNRQSFQSPNYEAQLHIDTERQLCALTEFSRQFLIAMNNTGQANVSHNSHQMILPMFSIYLEEDALETYPLFLKPNFYEFFSDQLFPSPSTEKMLLSVRVPNILSIGEVFTTFPILVHELSHNVRVTDRRERNQCVVDFVLKRQTKWLLRQMENSVSVRLNRYSSNRLKNWMYQLIEQRFQRYVERKYHMFLYQPIKAEGVDGRKAEEMAVVLEKHRNQITAGFMDEVLLIYRVQKVQRKPDKEKLKEQINEIIMEELGLRDFCRKAEDVPSFLDALIRVKASGASGSCESALEELNIAALLPLISNFFEEDVFEGWPAHGEVPEDCAKEWDCCKADFYHAIHPVLTACQAEKKISFSELMERDIPLPEQKGAEEVLRGLDAKGGGCEPNTVLEYLDRAKGGEAKNDIRKAFDCYLKLAVVFLCGIAGKMDAEEKKSEAKERHNFFVTLRQSFVIKENQQDRDDPHHYLYFLDGDKEIMVAEMPEAAYRQMLLFLWTTLYREEDTPIQRGEKESLLYGLNTAKLEADKLYHLCDRTENDISEEKDKPENFFIEFYRKVQGQMETLTPQDRFLMFSPENNHALAKMGLYMGDEKNYVHFLQSVLKHKPTHAMDKNVSDLVTVYREGFADLGMCVLFDFDPIKYILFMSEQTEIVSSSAKTYTEGGRDLQREYGSAQDLTMDRIAIVFEALMRKEIKKKGRSCTTDELDRQMEQVLGASLTCIRNVTFTDLDKVCLKNRNHVWYRLPCRGVACRIRGKRYRFASINILKARSLLLRWHKSLQDRMKAGNRAGLEQLDPIKNQEWTLPGKALADERYSVYAFARMMIEVYAQLKEKYTIRRQPSTEETRSDSLQVHFAKVAEELDQRCRTFLSPDNAQNGIREIVGEVQAHYTKRVKDLLLSRNDINAYQVSADFSRNCYYQSLDTFYKVELDEGVETYQWVDRLMGGPEKQDDSNNSG